MSDDGWMENFAERWIDDFVSGELAADADNDLFLVELYQVWVLDEPVGGRLSDMAIHVDAAYVWYDSLTQDEREELLDNPPNAVLEGRMTTTAYQTIWDNAIQSAAEAYDYVPDYDYEYDEEFEAMQSGTKSSTLDDAHRRIRKKQRKARDLARKQARKTKAARWSADEDGTKGDVTFNARQLIDKLREVDVRLYEEVLDTVAWEGYGRVGTWSDDDLGNMILHEDEETFEAPYAGLGALFKFGGNDSALGGFTAKELTESSAIHGDFDSASLNYSGHQNIEVRQSEADWKENDDLPFSGGMVEEYANYLEKICGNHWKAFKEEYYDRKDAETFAAVRDDYLISMQRNNPLSRHYIPRKKKSAESRWR